MPSSDPFILAEASRHSNARRRALRYDAYVEKVDSLILMERDDGVCGICGEDVDPLNYDLDHRTPLARGGLHNYVNTQIAHPLCNDRKKYKGDDPLKAGFPAAVRREIADERDLAVLALWGEGKGMTEIARTLGISHESVRCRIRKSEGN